MKTKMILTIAQLEDILNKAKFMKLYDDSLSNHIVLEQDSRAYDNYCNGKALEYSPTVVIQSSYAECIGKQISLS